jgi:hypothetical protein
MWLKGGPADNSSDYSSRHCVNSFLGKSVYLQATGFTVVIFRDLSYSLTKCHTHHGFHYVRVAGSSERQGCVLHLDGRSGMSVARYSRDCKAYVPNPFHYHSNYIFWKYFNYKIHNKIMNGSSTSNFPPPHTFMACMHTTSHLRLNELHKTNA